LKILEEHIPSDYHIYFSKRLVSYKDSTPNPVSLLFQDGTTAECDILVGADGIKSSVRQNMFTDLATNASENTQAAAYRRFTHPTWSGVVSYRALVKSEDFRAEFTQHISLSSPVCVRVSYYRCYLRADQGFN
jgi:salicylate hydroxylase